MMKMLQFLLPLATDEIIHIMVNFRSLNMQKSVVVVSVSRSIKAGIG